MRDHKPFYLQILRSTFSNRKRINSSYSLRAYARDLRIDSSNLSAILRELRHLPEKRAQKIADTLNLEGEKRSLFIKSTVQQKKNISLDTKTYEREKKFLLEDEYSEVISEWEYMAILQLMDTVDFKSSVSWMSKRLKVSEDRVKNALEKLKSFNFIDIDSNNQYFRNVEPIETKDNIHDEVIQRSHHESLNIAKNKLSSVEVEKRDFTSITFAADSESLPQVKALIREFQDRLYDLMSGSRDEVYKFNCQLFPLTESNKKEGQQNV